MGSQKILLIFLALGQHNRTTCYAQKYTGV